MFICSLYGTGNIATGDLNFTSTQTNEKLQPWTQDDTPCNTDTPVVGFSPFANLDLQGTSSRPMEIDEVEHTASAYSGQSEGNGKKRQQSQVAEVLQDLLDFRKKQSKVFVDELDEITKPIDEYSIKNCLALLESIKELSDEEKAKATSILKCELNREIFISFKNPRVRLLWVKDEIAPKVCTLACDLMSANVDKV